MIEVLNKEKFSHMIEKLVIAKRIPYMDAVVWWCEENEFDIEDTAKLLCPLIKEKIKVEAQDLNYLEKSARLPI